MIRAVLRGSFDNSARHKKMSRRFARYIELQGLISSVYVCAVLLCVLSLWGCRPALVEEPPATLIVHPQATKVAFHELADVWQVVYVVKSAYPAEDYIAEHKPGEYQHVKELRITEWPVAFLRRPRRTANTIPDFLSPNAPTNRLDILRGLASPKPD